MSFVRSTPGCVLSAILLVAPTGADLRGGGPAQVTPFAAAASVAIPAGAETLSYSVEWRLVYAGNARLTLTREPGATEDAKLHLESAGLVSKLFTIDDNYHAHYTGDQLCAHTASLDAKEGKRHKSTEVRYAYERGKAAYTETDVLKGAVVKTAETDIPACVTDILGGLYRLRAMKVEPGQSVQIPTSNGLKTANVKITAHDREEVSTKLGKFKTIRYEADVFNGVLYRRSGRLFVWITDDERRLPVQIQLRMQFLTIGTITLQLEKAEHA